MGIIFQECSLKLIGNSLRDCRLADRITESYRIFL